MDKPGKLSIERDKWPERRFKFESYMAGIDSHYAIELDQVAKLDIPVVIASGPAEDEVRMRSPTLYAILASIAQSKDLQIIKQIKHTRNGCEAWRLLVKEKEPNTDTRRLAMLSEVMAAQVLDNVKITDFETKLMLWEETVNEYALLGGIVFPDEIKRAILLQKAPVELRTHLQVNAGAMMSYQIMRDTLEAYLRAKNVWKTSSRSSAADASPMEVGGVRDHNVECYNCGRKGHTRAECFRPGGGAAGKAKGGKNNGGKGDPKGF